MYTVFRMLATLNQESIFANIFHQLRKRKKAKRYMVTNQFIQFGSKTSNGDTHFLDSPLTGYLDY